MLGKKRGQNEKSLSLHLEQLASILTVRIAQRELLQRAKARAATLRAIAAATPDDGCFTTQALFIY